MSHPRLNRREFLTTGALAVAVASSAPAEPTRDTRESRGMNGPELIASIEKETLRRGRDGSGPTWFHPRACMVPGDGTPIALMTLQEIGGSDYFGPVHWSESRDLGATWSDPEPIPALGRKPAPDDFEEGVCDVVPAYHPPTGTILALGHNVFYRDGRFPRQQPPRWPVYAVRSAAGVWSDSKRLEWDDPRGALIYTNNCGQRVTLPDGDILLAFTFGPKPAARSVAGVVCAFDGETLSIRRVGEELKHDVGRGLLEPSLTFLDDQFYLTVRAEDDHGYVAISDDGLTWSEKRPWCYDDGEPVGMSTTQQHWLTHSDALFLVYTRRDPSNVNVIRWRSPLWVSQVDREKLCLIRSTEQVVLPLVGDGVADPDRVALMGNFNVTNASPSESWVTVGEWMPRNGYRGDLLMARIRWREPNRLA